MTKRNDQSFGVESRSSRLSRELPQTGPKRTGLSVKCPHCEGSGRLALERASIGDMILAARMTPAEVKDLDLQALLAVVDAATPGPWKWDTATSSLTAPNTMVLGLRVGEMLYQEPSGPGLKPADGKYIAAFSPSVARELIERVMRAEAIEAAARNVRLAHPVVCTMYQANHDSGCICGVAKLEALLSPASLERPKP